MRISDWSSDVCSSDLYPLFQDSGESATALRQACIGPREDRSAFHGTVSVERERQETAGPTGIPAARAGLENHLSNGRRHSLDRRHRPKRGSVSGETMTVQIIDVAGKRMAVLPEDEYRRLLAVVADREDSDTKSEERTVGNKGVRTSSKRMSPYRGTNESKREQRTRH